ncbi:MAG: PH domain-containing protein [Nocardiopsaceae bacterium]|nr:PH domain-containing protein [Nocardiopsaceae bacterium]
MANNDLLTDGEEARETLHPHWKVLVRPVAVAVVVLVVLLVLELLIPAGSAAGIERLLVAALAIVFLMWWLVVPILRWRTTTYELTTLRVRVRSGILARDGRDFPLSRIVNISYRTSLLDRMFGSGTVVLETAGEHGDLALADIPHVQLVQSALFQLVEEERRLPGGEERPAT